MTDREREGSKATAKLIVTGVTENLLVRWLALACLYSTATAELFLLPVS